MNEKGFTIIEGMVVAGALVVVGIVATLIAVAIRWLWLAA